MNNWDVNKDTRFKEKVTHDIISLAPNCCGNRVALMTSRTYTDLKELLSQKKIDSSSVIYNFDNLQGKGVIAPTEMYDGETMEEAFERLWTKETNALFAENGMTAPAHKLIFDDILKFNWRTILKPDATFKFIYADTCNLPTPKFFDWLNDKNTVNSVSMIGNLAFTVTFSHDTTIPLMESSEYADKQELLGGYKTGEKMMHYSKKLNGLIHMVEEGGNWKVVKAIHYDEFKGNSQMVTAICQRA